MRKRGLKAIPKFRSEAEERPFWETHDSTEYVDWSKAVIARGQVEPRAGSKAMPRLRD